MQAKPDNKCVQQNLQIENFKHGAVILKSGTYTEFKTYFGRFDKDSVDYWNDSKLSQKGQIGIITAIYSDQTFEIIFRDGKQEYFPLEAIDKQIDIQIVKNIQALAREKQQSESALNIFNMLDANKNMYVNKQEVKQLAEALGQSLTDLEIDQLIMAADQNVDNKITFEEYHAYHITQEEIQKAEKGVGGKLKEGNQTVFKTYFNKHTGHQQNDWSEHKQNKSNQTGIIYEVYDDDTLLMIFNDGHFLKFPFEAFEEYFTVDFDELPKVQQEICSNFFDNCEPDTYSCELECALDSDNGNYCVPNYFDDKLFQDLVQYTDNPNLYNKSCITNERCHQPQYYYDSATNQCFQISTQYSLKSFTKDFRTYMNSYSDYAKGTCADAGYRTQIGYDKDKKVQIFINNIQNAYIQNENLKVIQNIIRGHTEDYCMRCTGDQQTIQKIFTVKQYDQCYGAMSATNADVQILPNIEWYAEEKLIAGTDEYFKNTKKDACPFINCKIYQQDCTNSLSSQANLRLDGSSVYHKSYIYTNDIEFCLTCSNYAKQTKSVVYKLTQNGIKCFDALSKKENVTEIIIKSDEMVDVVKTIFDKKYDIECDVQSCEIMQKGCIDPILKSSNFGFQDLQSEKEQNIWYLKSKNDTPNNYEEQVCIVCNGTDQPNVQFDNLVIKYSSSKTYVIIMVLVVILFLIVVSTFCYRKSRTTAVPQASVEVEMKKKELDFSVIPNTGRSDAPGGRKTDDA